MREVIVCGNRQGLERIVATLSPDNPRLTISQEGFIETAGVSFDENYFPVFKSNCFMWYDVEDCEVYADASYHGLEALAGILHIV